MQTSRFHFIAVTGCLFLAAGALNAQEKKHDINRVIRNSDGTPLLIFGRSVSGNWSGYGQENYLTNFTYTSASFNWTVPKVTYAGTSKGTEASAIWVGIGGNCENSTCSQEDSTLIQLGTEQDVSPNGTTNYYPWWEVLPAAETPIAETVEPGDQMTASLNCTANCVAGRIQTWSLSMRDVTQGWTFSKTVLYASSLLSVEWIVEAPYNGGILALADFGTATLSAATEDSANPGLASSQAIFLRDAHGETSSPSNPSGGDAFSACFAKGILFVSCPVPAN
jgi:Peptidase A4 family